ncbi:MAG: tetratricopeptide repeat protein [Deltaproteobacteria bacterium]|nr:tetratricopeptide repeat protein [Deltaproteobacteria bacterium]
MITKRTKARDISKVDQFQEYAWSIIRLVTEQRTKVFLVLGIILAAGVIAGGLSYYNSTYEASADTVYATAMVSETDIHKASDEREVNTKAIDRYTALINKYPRSEAATVALYHLGNLYFKTNDIDKSIQSYEEFLSKNHKNELLKQMTLYSLGYCYEVKGDFEKSLETFTSFDSQIAQGAFKSLSYLNIARVNERLGKTAKAREYYSKALENMADPGMAAVAKYKLSTLIEKG